MGNPFIHIELHTPNTGAAKDFYAKLLDWQLDDLEVPGWGTYTLVETETGTGGGMMATTSPDEPPHWLAYIEVDDVAVTAEKGERLGGTILLPKTPIPGFGHLAVIQDPTGAAVGLYEASKG